MATSALEKVRDTKKQHKIVEELPEGVPWAPNGASMVVSTPREIYAIINAVPEKKLLTLQAIRDFLAQRYGTTIACPVSTGIFITLSARASEELRNEGSAFAPWWRILKADGSLNPKFPGGTAEQKDHLEAEGFTITQVRKNFFVDNYQDYVWEIPKDFDTSPAV